MITKELIAYITGERAKGTDPEIIRSNLIRNGWNASDVAEAYATLGPASPLPPTATSPLGANMAPATMATQPAIPKRKGKKIVLAILVIVLVAGGAAYAYWTGYFTPLVKKENGSSQYPPNANSVSGTENNQNTTFPPSIPPTTTAQLDMSNPDVQTYKGVFTKEFAQPANFEGRFRIVPVGCGSGCFYLYALDKTTGKAYKITATDTQSATSETNLSYMNYVIGTDGIEITFQNGHKEIVTYNQATDSFENVIATD